MYGIFRRRTWHLPRLARGPARAAALGDIGQVQPHDGIVAGGAEREGLAKDYVYLKRKVNRGADWGAQDKFALLRQVEIEGRVAAELLDEHTFSGKVQNWVFDGNRLYVNWRPLQFYSEDDDRDETPDSWIGLSDQLSILDLSNLAVRDLYTHPTKTYRATLLGVYADRLFARLGTDGVIAIDISEPTRPHGQQFLRTSGSNADFAFDGGTAYVASGYYGTHLLRLGSQSQIPSSVE